MSNNSPPLKETKSASKSVGSNKLVETFGKIQLSDEIKSFLTTLNARVVVTYAPGGVKPEIEILDRKGHTVSSIDEFIKLSTFRRWANDEMKALKKTEASSEKITLLGRYLLLARAKGLSVAERMDDGNEARFRQWNAMVDVVENNIKVISGTVTGGIRAYTIEKAQLVVRILQRLMLACLGEDKLEKDALDNMLFNCGVPKWLYTKLVDKTFTSNLKHDARVLLFPKGNFLKGISLTTKELQSDEFVASNVPIVGRAKSTIALAKYDWSTYIPTIPKGSEKDFEKFLENHPWVLVHPYEYSEILEIRAAGKSAPSFKPRAKPSSKDGKKKVRPETEMQRICRESSNFLGGLNAEWVRLSHFLIPCVNPGDAFWNPILSGSITWEISPSHNLYHCIIESGSDLSPLLDLNLESVTGFMATMAMNASHISKGTSPGKELFAKFKEIANASPPTAAGAITTAHIDTILDVDPASAPAEMVTPKTADEAKNLLGIVSSQKKEKKKTRGGTSVRVAVAALNELKPILDHPLYGPVKEWIGSTFKTGHTDAVQTLAARTVIGEILHYKEELLGEEFDEEEALRNVEDSEEE